MPDALKNARVGFAMTGSFCTFSQAFDALSALAERGARLFPILSERAYATDTRFHTALEVRDTLERICGRAPLHTIAETEPIGPKRLLDLLIVAPCTGNTLAKLALGVTDTSVTMAAKAHRRNGGPLLLAISTNDGLSGSAANLGALHVRRGAYFVPYGQDDPHGKPDSLVARFSLLPDAAEAALAGRQLQPLLRETASV